MKKEEFIRIRVAGWQKKYISLQAEKAHKSLSQYVRDAAMDKDVTVIDGVDDLIRELHRQGNNLNQLVVMARQGHVELGIKLAEHFEGYQCIVVTHMNTAHIHNHIIMNSVNFETGMKFHQSAREMQQVKDYCSQLCREYGLSVTESKADPFRIPTWKRRLTDHIKEAMEQSRTQQEFVVYMNACGYDVKWEPHQKYITYTTPENIRCRDSKLFDQTLKRENMELYFRLGGADYLQACREIAYDHREPTPTLEDAVCGMAGTVAAICALCEDEDSEVSDLARELYYSSLLLQELVEWYQSRRQEQENYEEEYEQYHGFDMTMM